jgi:hypothetical protein
MNTLYDIPVISLDEEAWFQAVAEMKRMWDKDGRVHHPIDMVQKCLPFPDIIFIRKEDTWSVGCRKDQMDEVYSLYTREWEKILIKEGNDV